MEKGGEGMNGKLKDADIIPYALFLILGNAFGDPGYVPDFLPVLGSSVEEA